MSSILEPNQLNEGWVESTLKDISSYIQRGKSPKYTEFSGLPVVNQKCVRWEGIDKEHVKYIHPEQFEKWEEKRFLKEGDLLWNSTGTGTIGRATIVHLKQDEKLVVDSHVTIVRPSTDIEPKYVYYWIMSPVVQNSIEAMQSGSTNQVELSKGAVESTSIPVAPPEQQKQIVAKIEQLFSHIDAGIAALNTAKQRLKQYRQSVLKAAVTGELTKEWRAAQQNAIGCAEARSASIPQTQDALPIVSTSYESAEQLLERILKTRRQKWEEQQLEQFKAKGKQPKNDKWKERYKEPLQPEFEHIHDVPDIPKSWKWVTLSQLTTFVKDGPHYSPKYADSGIPFITGGNVRAHGVDFEKCKYITLKLHEELSKRCKPELNDILFTKGGTTGIARVNTYNIDFNVWVHVAVLRLVDTKLIEPFFIQHSLNSLLCYAQSQKFTHGVGNQDLGLTRMIKICLTLPPIEEQREIIKIIDQKMESITRVEKQVDHMLVMSEKNKQSILASAFSGKLSS